jgi:hypothetical protein
MEFLMFLSTKKILLAIGLLLFLSACGGGGDGAGGSATTTTKNGVLIDSAVMGARYESTSHSGLTDANGTFVYEVDEIISFYVGDILFGSTTGQSRVTPINFVANAVDASNPQVINIIRFLQTLDEDNNPDNGIVIPVIVSTMASGQTVDFSLSLSAFENTANTLVNFLTSGNTSTLISAAAAIAHFQSSTGIGGNNTSTSSGEFGGLDLSGADSVGTGTRFDASIASTASSSTIVVISWGSNTPGSVLTVTTDNGEVQTVIFVKVVNMNEVYAYSLSCNRQGVDCSGLSLNLSSKSLTFSGVSLPIGSATSGNTNPATAPLLLDGTVTWE